MSTLGAARVALCPAICDVSRDGQGNKKEPFGLIYFWLNEKACKFHKSNGNSIIVKTIKVSGTIRGCQRQIKTHHQSCILKESNETMRTKMIETENDFDDRLMEE